MYRSFFLCASLAHGALPADHPTIPMRGIAGNVPMPLAGHGTWQYDDTTAKSSSLLAFKVGVRHIDTALGYGNQVGVGEAMAESGLERDEFFITSKIPGGLDSSTTLKNLDQCLSQLNTSYVDLMLIHYPATWGGVGGPEKRKEEWLVLEKWAKTGRAKAIGVSHYCRSHIEDIQSVATVPIGVNQVQYHVGMGSAGDYATDYKNWVQSQGIVYQGFSSLCGPCGSPDNKELITGDLVTSIGKAHNVGGPQVALRYLVQQGIPVIPKSSKESHIKSDFDLFSFNLTDAEMARLTTATKPAVAGAAGASGDCDVKMSV